MRLEDDAALVDRAQGRQRQHLIAARIGEDRPIPIHESVQAAEPLDALRPRTQHQVIGVGEHDLGAGGGDRRRRHRLDRRSGDDRHEGGSLYSAVCGVQAPRAGRAVAAAQLEAEALGAHAPSRCNRQQSP
jgi:hypothetical protein